MLQNTSVKSKPILVTPRKHKGVKFIKLVLKKGLRPELSLRAINCNICNVWVCLIFPWCYRWNSLLLIEFKHKSNRFAIGVKTRLHVTRALKTHTYVFLNKVTSTLIWFTVNLQVEAKTMSKHIGEEFIIKPQRCTRWRRRTWKQAVNAYKLQSMYSKFKINQTLHL